MSIHRLSFLENIKEEFDRLSFDEIPGPLLMYTVVATPKDGEPSAVAPEALVDIVMNCWKGTTRTTAYSIPDKWGYWNDPTRTESVAPPGYAAGVSPWPNVPMEEAWRELKGPEPSVDTMVKSVTLSQVEGTPEAQLPVWTFVLESDRSVNIVAYKGFL